MNYEFITLEKKDRIATITIDHPPVNSLNRKTYEEIDQVSRDLNSYPDVKVVILTAAGEKAFAAGLDIKEVAGKSMNEMKDFCSVSSNASNSLAAIEKPVIAAINGFALGGGCELAMCCDLRVASENAKFGQPEINLGIIPGAGGTQRLTRLVGMTRAKELIYTGSVIDANVAFTMGLVNKVVPPNNLMEESKVLARKMLGKSSVALSLAKEAINGGSDASLYSGLDLEGQCFALCFATEDQKEGMAAFLEKRKSEFKGK